MSTAATFCGDHVSVLAQDHVTVFLKVHDPQHIGAEVCRDAAVKHYLASSIHPLRSQGAHHGMVAETGGTSSQVTLPHTVIGVERERCDEEVPESLLGVDMQVTSGAQISVVGRWPGICLVHTNISTKPTKRSTKHSI